VRKIGDDQLRRMKRNIRDEVPPVLKRKENGSRKRRPVRGEGGVPSVVAEQGGMPTPEFVQEKKPSGRGGLFKESRKETRTSVTS